MSLSNIRQVHVLYALPVLNSVARAQLTTLKHSIDNEKPWPAIMSTHGSVEHQPA